MKPAPFAYARPETVEEALELLDEYGADARVLAGGQSLAAMLNMRLVQPRLLIDISGLPALATIEQGHGAVTVGASVTQAALLRSPALAAQPLLGMMLPWVGHMQPRERGTVCGSLAHGDPSAELPLALAMLGGEVALRSRSRQRRVPASGFQNGVMRTDIDDNEMVVSARFPVPAEPCGAAFREVSPRHGDFAIVAVAAIADARGVTAGFGGIAERPLVRRLAHLGDDALADALNAIAWEAGGESDMHATASYRRHRVRKLGPVVIREACDALSRG